VELIKSCVNGRLRVLFFLYSVADVDYTMTRGGNAARVHASNVTGEDLGKEKYINLNGTNERAPALMMVAN
jgi:hypothetical protein